MARIRDDKAFKDTKVRLLETGLELIRSQSYAAVGINDVLKAAKVPRGSFYHYFASKEAYGLEVAKYYHTKQLRDARQILLNGDMTALERLEAFFLQAYQQYERLDFSQGCLMCNLSIELGDTNFHFQELLNQQWKELSSLIGECIEMVDRKKLKCDHLTVSEAAEWLLNSWSGALIRMKADRNGAALKLFLKSVF